VILLRYFAREIFITMFAVTGIVLVISMGWRFSGYLENAAAGLMSREVLFAVMAYRLPGFLELIIPVSYFLSIMLVHGRMHVDSEMIVLQACGMSTGRLIQMTLLTSLAVMVMTAMISLWLKPMGERQVEILLGDQSKLTEFDTLIPGRFQMLTSGKRVTYTEGLSDKGELAGVFINEYKETAGNEPRQAVTVIADSGRTQVDGAGRRFLVLNNGRRYQGKPGEKNFQSIDYEEYGQLVDSGGSIKRKKTPYGYTNISVVRCNRCQRCIGASLARRGCSIDTCYCSAGNTPCSGKSAARTVYASGPRDDSLLCLYSYVVRRQDCVGERFHPSGFGPLVDSWLSPWHDVSNVQA